MSNFQSLELCEPVVENEVQISLIDEIENDYTNHHISREMVLHKINKMSNFEREKAFENFMCVFYNEDR